MIPATLRRFAERNTHAGEPGRVWIDQRGSMSLKPGAAWKPFSAEQWMDESRLAFVWHARVKMAPLLTAVVEDAYENGAGRLDVKMWGRVRVAHEEGPAMNRGEVQRYLAELPWNPGAIRHNQALHFEESERGIRAWCGERDTYVDLEFDAEGDIVGTYTDTRLYEGNAHPWVGRFENYVELGGMRIPSRGAVAWELPKGSYEYWRGEITSVRLEPRG